MADDKARDAIKEAAASYRADLIAAGRAQERAGAEQAQAARLENRAAGLRDEARADTQRAGRRMRM
jgi:hypothetical protein